MIRVVLPFLPLVSESRRIIPQILASCIQRSYEEHESPQFAWIRAPLIHTEAVTDRF